MKYADNTISILCDDIRREIGKKLSVIGMYQGGLTVNKLPSILPKITLLVLFDGVKKPAPQGKVLVKLPGQETDEMKIDPLKDAKKGDQVFFTINISPLVVKEEGEGIFEFYAGKAKEPYLVHKFDIEVAKKP